MPKRKYGPKNTTRSCSIRGVPLTMDMYSFTKRLSGLNFDSLPAAISSPRGREKISVRKNIEREAASPFTS